MNSTPLRVLIVDDHKILRRGLREVIEEDFPGAEFAEAENSQTALEQVYASKWDLVLLDVNIPGRSGMDVLVEIKQTQPDTPVLVISAYPEEQFAIRALKLRAAGYLTKDCVADELNAAIRKALSGGRYVTSSLAERLALSMGSDIAGARHDLLSNRELQVLRLIAIGRSIKDIAGELSLSDKTVSTYRHRIAEKMGLASNVELTRYALQHQLVE
ncbi:MAG: response regulator transcription factor [Verrucomicrobiota bacterium]|nr:response regulator transcription factor [Verrucomicrobiota bacterium]